MCDILIILLPVNKQFMFKCSMHAEAECET